MDVIRSRLSRERSGAIHCFSSKERFPSSTEQWEIDCVRLPRPGRSGTWFVRDMVCPIMPSVPMGVGVAGGPESVRYGWEAGRSDLTG